MNMRQHLKERGFTDELLEVLNPALDDEEGLATFMLYNLSGQMLGYQHYRPGAGKNRKNDPKDCRYYTYRPKSKEAVAIGGLETYHWSDTLYVVEGVFKALPLWRRNLSAVWTCGIPDRPTQHWLKNQGKRVVTFLDPGVTSSQRRCFRRCSRYLITPEDFGVTVDLDETPSEVVDKMLKSINR